MPLSVPQARLLNAAYDGTLEVGTAIDPREQGTFVFNLYSEDAFTMEWELTDIEYGTPGDYGSPILENPDCLDQ